jgi:exopolysaccharide biosynthesis operon protein EpsL
MRRTYAHVALCLLLAVASPRVMAQSESPITLRFAYSMQVDSNLFRLPTGAKAQALVGRADASEQIGATSLGLSFKTRQSLQQFELSALMVDYQYQNFSYLSFTASNFDAAWRWSVTPRLHGSLTARHTETLNNFADFPGYKQRNVRLDTGTALDSEFEVDGPWRLLAGVSTARQSNQVEHVVGSDYSTISANAGVRYDFASGSAISFLSRAIQGEYLNAFGPSFDNAFKQKDQDLRLHWAFSGNSSADANLTYSARTHPNFGVHDFDGFDTGISLNWLLSGKSSLAAGYQHQIGAYVTANSNYSQTDTLALNPVWQFSPKASLRLQSKYEQVQFLGAPATVSTALRRDTNRELTLSLNWQPHDKLSFATSVGAQSRWSSQPGLDYDSNTLSVAAQLIF